MNKTTAKQSIGLLGTGAIGSLMAMHWSQQTLYCLPKTRGAGASLRVQDLNGNLHSLTLPCWQGEALDWLVITTKAADTLPALQSWADYLPGVQRILLLQNGMGQQQACADWLAANGLSCELWAAISTEGAYRILPDNQTDDDLPLTVYAGAGTTVAGRWPGTPAAGEEPELPPGIERQSDILPPMRAKLAINAVINPLTAVLHCQNGELVSNPLFLPQLQALALEIDGLYQQLGWALSEPLPQKALMVAQATAANYSSSYQDVAAGRPTELDYICGYLLDCASRQQLELPLTRQLLQTVNRS